jgi:DNA-binding beta-propeller fold protein YncE
VAARTVAAVAALVAVLLPAVGALAAAPNPRLPFAPRYLPDAGRMANQAWARQAGSAHAGGEDPASAQHSLSAATLATTPVGAGPGWAALDQATDTIYVANDGPGYNGTGHTVSVIDGRTCRTANLSRCRHASPTVTVGTNPAGLAVDQATDTIYVTNQNSGTVSVIDGATCNSQVTSGCKQNPPRVPVGGIPVAVTVDQANHTAYVVNAAGNDVSMINTAACNAAHLSGCSGQHPPTVAVGVGPAWAAVNQKTHTVYVANDNFIGTPTVFNNGTTVSVFDASACNATTQAGCSHQGLITVGTGPIMMVADPANNTAYTTNIAARTVSVIDGRTCDAADLAGCAAQTPGAVTVGVDALWATLDGPAHTLYVANFHDGTVSVINTSACNGQHQRACARLVAPTLQTGDEPIAAEADPATSTLYVANGLDNNVSVIDTAKCDAAQTAGCRHPAPTVPDHEYLLTADPATNTIYASHLLTSPTQRGWIDVINGATCHTKDLSRCAPVAEIPAPADVGALDDATHTLYASETHSGTVFVINTATCNATHTAGCAHTPPATAVGAAPGPPVLNPATGTLYVPLLQTTTANQVAVVNVATCNAETTSGCGQPPATVKVGPSSILAVSAQTNTIYAPSYSDNTVAVINGATCNGTDHSGCGHLAATAKVGSVPYGAAVSDGTHTLYVANNANGNALGTVSVINTATCNGTDTTGCGGPFPTIATGLSPLLVAVDNRTGAVYVTDYSSAAVTILNGRRCSAVVTSDCRRASREQAVGSQPFGLAINPRTSTVYVTQVRALGSLSIFTAAHH